MLITKRVEFSASHACRNPQLSDRENEELFGAAANPHGHGHDYILEVRVRGPLDPVSGQVVNVSALDRLVAAEVLDDFDHRYMNADVLEFQEVIPTSENILGVIEERLAAHWQTVFPGDVPHLEAIRLRETRRNLFELRAS